MNLEFNQQTVLVRCVVRATLVESTATTRASSSAVSGVASRRDAAADIRDTNWVHFTVARGRANNNNNNNTSAGIILAAVLIQRHPQTKHGTFNGCLCWDGEKTREVSVINGFW